MNILERPELVDRLAAAYALGTLRGGARRRFETLARRSPSLRVAAQLWQERLMAMTELQQSMAPGPNVWKRIENMLAAEQRPQALPTAADRVDDLVARVRNLWRGVAVAGGAAAVIALAVALNLRGELQGRDAQLAQLQAQGLQLARQNQQLNAMMAAQPEIRYVAVLHDDKATPTMLVTYDPKHNQLSMRRMPGFEEGPDKSLQLWALPPTGGPRSLGVIGNQPVARMPAAEQVVGQSPVLAVSLEPRGGVPEAGGPTGPVLWKGAVLQAPL